MSLFLLSKLLKTILASYLIRRAIKNADVFVNLKRYNNNDTFYCDNCHLFTISKYLDKCYCNNSNTSQPPTTYQQTVNYFSSLQYIY